MRVGLVGAGAMGTALGAGYLAGGSEVVTCLTGRSVRSRDLVAGTGIEPVGDLDEVVRSDVVVSVVPPGQARAVARDVAAACERTGARPVVTDLNAIAPTTVADVARMLDGLPFVDGSISGPPPTATRSPRVYLCGPHTDRLPANPWLDVVRLDGPVGTASALKMCTASMYKGTKALVLQAMATAQAHGVLDEFLADVARQWPDDVPGWPGDVALAVSKADRFVDEMHEIARTQAAAGQQGALFDGVAATYSLAATSRLAQRSPEDAAGVGAAAEVLAELADRPRHAVLFDFSGTLFHNEPAEHALLAALGPEHVHRAAELVRMGAINGSSMPEHLPDHLVDVWARRDLSPDAHRAAYSGSARHAGLSVGQADALYERGVSPEAWSPYPDTVDTLRALRRSGTPVAIVSNIGWDPRPVLRRYGVLDDVDALILSDELGVQKPDAEIFAVACRELGVDPHESVMIGDDAHNDGGAQALGIGFRLVAKDAAAREPDALWRAAGLAERAPTHTHTPDDLGHGPGNPGP